jgi:hypothetical protein
VKLKLIQSGGIAGKIMEAEASSKLKEEDFEALLKTVKTRRTRGKMKDAETYMLQKSDDDKTAIAIDINAIPPSHNKLFKKLFENLRPKD